MTDRTKLECIRCKNVVEELQQRHAKGETSLTIHKGIVIIIDNPALVRIQDPQILMQRFYNKTKGTI